MDTCKRSLHAVADRHNLTVQQIGALYQLYTEGEIPMKTLAGRLHCDASNITGITDRLVSRNLIERQESPHDRRTKLLTLTPSGAAIIDEAKRTLPSALKLQSLDEPQRQQALQWFRLVG
jgi:DNA-binding MarR family transcriptional regulator